MRRLNTLSAETGCTQRLHTPGRVVWGCMCRGFTLIELLLALGVIAIAIGGLWPGITKSLAHSRLREAALEVEMLLQQGRLLAIEQTEPYQFRFEPEGQAAVLVPVEGLANALSTVETRPKSAVILDKGLRFSAIEGHPTNSADVLTEKLSANAFVGLSGSDRLSATNWSLPVVFATTGTTTDITLRISDEQGNSIDLFLRGLTAAVRVGSVIEGTGS